MHHNLAKTNPVLGLQRPFLAYVEFNILPTLFYVYIPKFYSMPITIV